MFSTYPSEKYDESSVGKDDIPYNPIYEMEKQKMFETTNQMMIVSPAQKMG